MDLIHAKGSSFYAAGKVTLMKAYTIVDVYGTQERFDNAVAEAKRLYSDNPAKREKMIKEAEFEKNYNPLKIRVQNQKTLEKTMLKPAGEKEEQGYLKDINFFDCEVGIENNNFELKIEKVKSMTHGIELGDYVYIEGTEFGGIIDGRTIDTATDEIIWTGTCWRGLLTYDVIRPRSGADYRKVTGDANSILRTILAEDGGAGKFFTVPDVAAGITFTNYEFPRYINKLKGLKDMLETKNHRLKIWTQYDDSTRKFAVMCCSVPIGNYSQEIEYSQDTNRLDIKMVQDYSVCNHLICLGAGELKDRTVIDLYVNKYGKIKSTKPDAKDGYFGVYERTLVYDYGSVEGETDAKKRENLKNEGVKTLKELNEVDNMELTVSDIEVDVGDIVAGLDRTTGIEMQKAITNKIVRIDSTGSATVELGVNGKEVDWNDID